MRRPVNANREKGGLVVKFLAIITVAKSKIAMAAGRLISG